MPLPFVPTDGGRAASKRPRQRNDCTVRALALACGVTYDSAYDELAEAGRRCGRGFEFGTWAGTAHFAGRTFRWIGFPAVKGQQRMNPAGFADQHPRGRYILKTAKHVLACVDGMLHDTAAPDPGRCVYGAWAVETADPGRTGPSSPRKE